VEGAADRGGHSLYCSLVANLNTGSFSRSMPVQLSAERQAVAQPVLRWISSSNVEGPAFAEEGSHLAFCGIGGFSEFHKDVHNAGISSRSGIEKQAVIGETDHGGDGTALLRGSGANDRDRPELCIEEHRRLRHDQIGLEFVRDIWPCCACVGVHGTIKVRKREGAVRYIGRIARLVMPGLEVRDLRPADTQ
jgi:hypothetical protein